MSDHPVDEPTAPEHDAVADEATTPAPEQAETSHDAPAGAAPEAGAAAQPEPEPEQEAAPDAAAQPEPEPEQEAAPDAAAQPEPEAALDAGAQPEPKAEPEAGSLAAAQPRAVPAPRPGPPRIPTPAALAGRVHPAPVTPPPAHSESARFGRVEPDGTVLVRDGDAERPVGSFPGASDDEALQYFARKYDELAATADLLHQRLTSTDVGAKEAGEALTALHEHTTEPLVVGDLAALRARVTEIEGLVARRRESEAAERSAARAAAAAERETLVSEAERIAAQDPAKVQWKTSSERMRTLLEEWKQHQRSGPKLDKPTENAMWQRFSHARNSFDKSRRSHFAQLEDTQADAKRAKEALAKQAEALATSKDWSPTARAFKGLMDQWRQAGRASRADDDALWKRFKEAQDAFFNAKDEVSAAEDKEFRANLAVKEQLLTEAQAILPVRDLEAAKSALRVIQDKWDQAGKVPRGDMERIEKAMRAVESTVRGAEDARWRTSNPEVAARANSMVTQLESSLAALRDDLAAAEASGNDRKVKDIRGKVEAQEAWLAQARAGLAEHGG